MKAKTAALVTGLVLFLAAAAPAADPLEAYVGTWGSQDTKAVYQISLAGDTLDIQAVDTSDGERFVIKDIQVLNGELFFTSVMPSTDWTVHHHVLPINENELQVTRSGDSEKGGKLFRQ